MSDTGGTLESWSDPWRAIAEALADALESFMSYDGYGQGGADDMNRGNWRNAEKALDDYRKASQSGRGPQSEVDHG